MTLVSKLHPDANLFEPPPPYSGKGRPRVKGRRCPSRGRRPPRRGGCGGGRSPGTAGARGGWARSAGTGHWYKAGAGLVPIRWVFVRDRDGTHRDEYFFTTDPALDPATIIETYYGALEHRDHLSRDARLARAWRRRGAGAARRCCGWRPCLFGLYTVVALLYQALPESKRTGPGGVAGEVGRDVLRRADGGAAVAVAGVGFPTGRSGPGRAKTPGAGARAAALRPCTGSVSHERIRISRVKSRCPKCGEHYNPASIGWHPHAFGPGLQAWTIYQRVVLRLPYEIIAQVMDHLFGIGISIATLVEFVGNLAEYYAPTEAAILQAILKSNFVHVDETKINIQGVDHYVWVFTDGRHVIFRMTETREADIVREVLAGYQGVLISDFYPGYDGVPCNVGTDEFFR